jgi:RNA polymerase-binding transcription factor DksA
LKQQQRYDKTFEGITDSREAEREEHAQEERDTRVLENLDERQQQRLADVDAALARIEAGAFGQCQNCGRPIGEDCLRSNPTTRLCIDYSARNEEPQENTEAAEREPATRPSLPPDLNLLDDNELQRISVSLSAQMVKSTWTNWRSPRSMAWLYWKAQCRATANIKAF